MSDLYDEDFVVWTERQATLLRRRAAGEPTIPTQRQEIEDLLADNPSLRVRLPEFFSAAFPPARADALEETGLGVARSP